MRISALVGVMFVAVAACGGSADGVDQGDDQDQTGGGTKLLFEGTCSFLHDCSTFSQKLPKGEVSFGCTGVQVCDDTERWLAGPNRSFCGKTVSMCKGTTCTTAVVKDVSVSHSWEASPGTLDALDLPHGLTGKCGGFGGGTVKLTVK